MRFLLLIAGAIFSLVVTYSAIKIWGDSQVRTPFKTAYFSDAEYSATVPVIALPWEQAFFSEKVPSLILWVDIYKSTKSEILAKPSSEIFQPIQKKPMNYWLICSKK